MAAGTQAITIAGNTISFGTYKRTGLNLFAWTSNGANANVSINGVSGKQGIIYSVNADDITNHTITGASYATVALWIAAFNAAIAAADPSGVGADIAGIETDVETITTNTNYPDTPFGDKLTVGTTRAQIMGALAKGGWLTIKADAANTDSLWVGTVTVADEDGYLLAAGDEITVESDNLGEWYIIGGAAGQVYYIIGAYKA